MNVKELTEIQDYLKIIQVTYNKINWNKKGALPVKVEAISNTRIFFSLLSSQIPLEEISKPTDIYPTHFGEIGIEWSKINNKAQMDIFDVIIRDNGNIFYRSILDSLGTNIEKESVLSDAFDELLLIHIKHFS